MLNNYFTKICYDCIFLPEMLASYFLTICSESFSRKHEKLPNVVIYAC